MSVVKCKNRKNTKKNNKYIIETKTENVTWEKLYNGPRHNNNMIEQVALNKSSLWLKIILQNTDKHYNYLES
jgi:hypothetical protein